jgi:hypothetical protein
MGFISYNCNDVREPLREPLKASKHANLGHEILKPSTHTIIRMVHKGSHHKIDQPGSVSGRAWEVGRLAGPLFCEVGAPF